MARFTQFIFGVVILIVGCLGMIKILPLTEIASYSFWTVGMISVILSWR